ncbi:MAG: LAGLIDADG family homing endonuclease [Phycisphaeraceae bacterium]
MKITRKYTKAGQDVFDSVQWTTRSSKISNPDGSVVFEMKDAQVPASWSQLATDIMVSKYFRKAGVPLTPEGMDPIKAIAQGKFQRDEDGKVVTGPEKSVKQVIHRLAGCWRQWGEKHGYFHSAQDAQAFYDEIAHMMLTQMCAPNSPQWFNTGLNFAYGISGPAQGHWVVDAASGEAKLADDAYTHPQPHACFIQSCDDDLVNPGGIMDLWVREARLFKYGSGTGTNFSKLRGENEPLSGGGKSSGLMSFLKIGDRAAGAIKSGGTTRRAAKMVCLDLDHPDIENFVNWKVREEVKVAALVEGMKHLSAEQKATAQALGLTLDYDFNGESYMTVSGQNSNNSVRIPSSFFDRLDADGDWDLVRRIDGKVGSRIKAKRLWDEICYAAWRCADPGVQYDTTINQWHTCPNSGRINASNPCVTGDTLVATSTGYRRIADLVGETAEVINAKGEKAFVDRIFKTGHKPVYTLRTRSGYELRLTADHRVLTLNRGDVPACELTVDDVVLLRGAGFGDQFVPEALGEVIGAAVGDGCLTHQPGQDFMFISVGKAEQAVAQQLAANIAECKQWLDHGDGRSVREAGVVQTQTGLRVGTSVQALLQRITQLAVLDGGSQAKQFTDAIFSLDQRSVAAILRGLFTTDGTVANYGSKSQYVALDSTSQTLLQQVQLLLLSFGIKSKLYCNRRAADRMAAVLPDGKGGTKEYAVQQMHSLRISRSSRRVFEQSIGFMASSAKAQQLAELNRQVASYSDRLVDRVATLTSAGTEDVFDLTEPTTHHFVANGMVVHNCSEYMFLDNTACNLASFNLLKFYDSRTRQFDLAGFEHATRLWTVVLEISVLMAAFPSREIARLSYDFRTLGLGYANLGAMLMQAGIPYDSEEARAICGAITAILTGRSYATSSEMAARLGPFPGYFKNREAMLRVIRNHRRAAHGVSRESADAIKHEQGDYEGLDIKPVPIDAHYLDTHKSPFGGIANGAAMLKRARTAWDDALVLGQKHGYRNAQTTVIAPTGTIGLLMDCDTTGVEPDFALVKFKKLSGGGYFKIANQSLPPALEALGYTEAQIKAILTDVLGANTLSVPMPDRNGQVPQGATTFADYLKNKGLTDADLAKVGKSLVGAMELKFVFNTWTLGQDAVKRLEIDPKSPDLLKVIGLTRKQIGKLNDMVCGTGTVEGAVDLKPEHLPVFDCANKCGKTGRRFIEVEGHIRMMGAAQPFISGAISKTINLPNEANVTDISKSYRLSWELGLKANALYRDGCKLSQPLNSSADADTEVEDEEGIAAGKEEVSREVASVASLAASAAIDRSFNGELPRETVRTVEKIVERIVHRPMRRRLLDTRNSITHKFNVGGHEGYLTVGLYEDGMPGELFITMAKEGSTIGGVMDSLGTAISVALQYGVPVESLVNKFTHQRFEPAGMTHNPDIPFAKSLVDYIFRWIGMEFIAGYRAANAPRRARKDDADHAEAAPAPVIVTVAAPGNGKKGHNGGGGDDDGHDHGLAHAESSGLSRAASSGDGLVDSPRRRGGGDGGEVNIESQHRRKLVGTAGDSGKSGGDGEMSIAAASVAMAMREMQSDAPACDVCGTITVRSGTCYKCVNCGNSMGCS